MALHNGTGIRCSHPQCGFQAHPDPEFGTFCCRQCHKDWAEGKDTPGGQHGKQCKQVPAHARCRLADPIRECTKPLTKAKRCVRGTAVPEEWREANAPRCVRADDAEPSLWRSAQPRASSPVMRAPSPAMRAQRRERASPPVMRAQRRERAESPVVPKAAAGPASHPRRHDEWLSPVPGSPSWRGRPRAAVKREASSGSPAPKRYRLGQAYMQRRAAESSSSNRRPRRRSPTPRRPVKREGSSSSEQARSHRQGPPGRSSLLPEPACLVALLQDGRKVPLREGLRVKAKWRDKPDSDSRYGKKWYDGVIKKTNRDGTILIDYNDGSLGLVSVEYIKLEDGTQARSLEAVGEFADDLEQPPDYSDYSSDADQEQEEVAEEAVPPAQHATHIEMERSPHRGRAPDVVRGQYQRSRRFLDDELGEEVDDGLVDFDRDEVHAHVLREQTLVATFLLQRGILRFWRPLIDFLVLFCDLREVTREHLVHSGMSESDQVTFLRGVQDIKADPTAIEDDDRIIEMLERAAGAEVLPAPARWTDEEAGALDRRLPPMHSVPIFSPYAAGKPADWTDSSRTLWWGPRTQHCFPRGRGEVSVHKFMDFLRLRACRDGTTADTFFGPPESRGKAGWFRLPWAFSESWINRPAIPPARSWEKTAWHGTKVEALYSIIYHGKLLASKCEAEGHRYHPEAPGVQVYDCKERACNYAQFAPVFRDGFFWAAVWEVKVDRRKRLRAGEGEDPGLWVQPEESVKLEALWLCGRSSEVISEGDEIISFWDPMLEAHPLKQPI